MSFADPQTITISSATTPLPRVGPQGENGSRYMSADGLISLSASTIYGRRTRRQIRVDHAKISPDVFVPSQNVKLSMSNYLVFDLPQAGYTNAEALAVWLGFKTQLAASSDALIVKLLGGES